MYTFYPNLNYYSTNIGCMFFLKHIILFLFMYYIDPAIVLRKRFRLI